MKTFGPGGNFGNPLNIGTPAGRRNAGGYYMMKQQERMRNLQMQRMRQQQQQRMWQQPPAFTPLHYRKTDLSYTAPYESAPAKTGGSGKWIFFIILAIVLFVLFA